MARTRDGASLIDDALKKADLEAFTARYPRTEVLRHINQGGAELWEIILAARGRAFGRSATPWTITTSASTTTYTTGFPTDFLELLSVRLDGPGGAMLDPLEGAEEAWNLEPGITGTYPLFYELVPGGLRLLPVHAAGKSVVVDYAKAFTDLTDSGSSTFDGVSGWEDYMVCHAARELFLKEGEVEAAREMTAEKGRLAARVNARAANRDAFRPKRARDVRGERMMIGRGGGRWTR